MLYYGKLQLLLVALLHIYSTWQAGIINGLFAVILQIKLWDVMLQIKLMELECNHKDLL
jgi:hypothetical protein